VPQEQRERARHQQGQRALLGRLVQPEQAQPV